MHTLFHHLHTKRGGAVSHTVQVRRTFTACSSTVSTHHLVHEGDKTPEGIHLVLHHEEDRRQQVAHPLDVT